jgi:chromosome segregation ATPase
MKTIKIFFIPFVIALLFISAIGNAQTDKKQDQLKKLEDAVNKAKAKNEQNERKVFVADSLISSGEQMIADADAEYSIVDNDLKALDKTYATNHKSITKMLNSKDPDEASKAKADLKALDTQYKADVKAIDTRIKILTKKANKGNSDLTKGKEAKKTTSAALKESQKALDAASKKYEAAVNQE